MVTQDVSSWSGFVLTDSTVVVTVLLMILMVTGYSLTMMKLSATRIEWSSADILTFVEASEMACFIVKPTC